MSDIGCAEREDRTDGRAVGKRSTVLRVLLWLGGATLALLLLVGLLNLVAPRAIEGAIGDPPAPTALPMSAQPQAAIIDQTGYSFPSTEFIAQAQATLEEAGYVVTYHQPEEVTVGFYRMLPDRGYNLILFQTHATSEVVVRSENEDESDVPPGPFLFTTELYVQQRYLTLQASDQVRASELFFEGSPQLFAVGPKFVRRSMRGLFPGTVMVIAGCQSLAVPDLAEAFLEKGAAVVIGWDEMVTLSHNNRAVLRLLEAMLVEGLPPEEAVERTMGEVGPDPEYGSSLDVIW